MLPMIHSVCEAIVWRLLVKLMVIMLLLCHKDGDGYGCHVWFCEEHGSLLLLVKIYT